MYIAIFPELLFDIHYELILYGILAQLGEHLPYKQRVTGSSPVGPIYAAVAELADAQDLKSCCSDTVPVRFRSAAFIQKVLDEGAIMNE